ncbi:transmembrane amino acid transporter protein-domain-containing protein [Hyaloraphidium curvatum]|nr:transmembrane amino acid transporter protein-domain-containing protein [Hyaloraphidium curvatum]
MDDPIVVEDDDAIPAPAAAAGRGHTPLPTSLASATVNYSVQVVGLPVLVVSYSLAVSGWVMGLAVWVVVGVLMGWTALLTCRCIEYGRTDYPMVTMLDMVSGAFGSPALSSIVWFCFLAELFGSNVTAYIVISHSMVLLWPSLSPIAINCWISVIAFIMAQFLSYRLLSLTSVLGIFVCLFTVLVVPWNGLTVDPGTPGSILTPAPTTLWPVDWTSATLLFGIVSGSFAAHSSLPSVYLSLEDRAKGNRDVAMVSLSFAFAFASYLAIGVCGFLMFGTKVEEEITVNLGRLQTNKELNRIATALILLLPMAQYPLWLEPVRVAVDMAITRYAYHLKEPSESDPAIPVVAESVAEDKETEPLLQRTRSGSVFDSLRTPLLRLFLIMLAMTISILVPSFANLLSLTGALCSSVTAILVPVACYLKLFYWDGPPPRLPGQPEPYRASTVEVVFGIASLVFGLLLAVIGTVGTILNM